MHAGDRLYPKGIRGFSVAELLSVILAIIILAAISVPVFNNAMTDMQMSSTVNAISAAISQTRYSSIMNGQVYTLAFTAPADTYVVTNVTTNIASATVPLPNQTVNINGGTSATYTYTLCPNGIVFGAGGACPGNTAPPSLTVQNQAREITINVSSVGNVSTTSIQ